MRPDESLLGKRTARSLPNLLGVCISYVPPYLGCSWPLRSKNAQVAIIQISQDRACLQSLGFTFVAPISASLGESWHFHHHGIVTMSKHRYARKNATRYVRRRYCVCLNLLYRRYARINVRRYGGKTGQKIREKEYQKLCRKECQQKCQKDCQKECQKICQKECRKI